MRWKKLGLVYCPTGEMDWAVSHAFIPTPWLLNDKTLRLFCAFLSADKVGRIGFVDLDPSDPLRILRISKSPVLDIGQDGTFDDNGVTPMCIVESKGKLYLYYTGWQIGTKVRYYLFTGLAVSDNGGETFTRCSQVPILDRCDNELFVRTAVHVHYCKSNWRMWYIGGERWITHGKKLVPSYNMRYVESVDGLNWPKHSTVCLDLSTEDEYGFGRPFVLRKNGKYQMWYSIRSLSKGYRLGYAESEDGLQWVRKDELIGIDVSPTGWDSEMICFACIQPTRYGTYMFYNGNNYGETGFGVAVLED